MGGTQTKPCGAYADVKELEYISALHQTSTPLRKDGSIIDEDVRMFLMSRYGIRVSILDIRNRIFGTFGECVDEYIITPTQEQVFATKGDESGEETDAPPIIASIDSVPSDVKHGSTGVLAIVGESGEESDAPTVFASISNVLKNSEEVELGEDTVLHVTPVPSSDEVLLANGGKAGEESATPVANGGESGKETAPPVITSTTSVPDGVKNSISSFFKSSRDDGKSFMDLTQILSLLLVPELLKAERSLTTQKLQNNDDASPFAFHEKGQKRWPDIDLIYNALRIMLHDATGDGNPRPLTKETLRQILTFYGEIDTANDDVVLDDMLAALRDKSDTSADDETSILFDQYAFSHALTQDVKQYNVDSENYITTNFYDVFESLKGKCNKTTSFLSRFNPFKTEEIGTSSTVIERVFTFAAIDYTADSFRERAFVVTLWLTWTLAYLAFVYDDNSLFDKTKISCMESADSNQSIPSFGCSISQQIINWLCQMAQLSILGTLFVVWASLGNSTLPISIVFIVIGMVPAVMFVLSYFMALDLWILTTAKVEGYVYMVIYIFSLVGGIVLLLASVLNMAQRRMSRKYDTDKNGVIDATEVQGRLGKWLIPGMVRLEACMKKSASFKMNQLLRNASEIHKIVDIENSVSNDVTETQYGKALLAYAQSSSRTEEIQMSFVKTWKKMYDRTLFEEDGIWFSSFLLIGILAQIVVMILILAVFFSVYKSEMFQELLLHLDTLNSMSSRPYLMRWRVLLPFYFGATCAELTVIHIAMNYLPSTVMTILQYRSGALGTLHSSFFSSVSLSICAISASFPTFSWWTHYFSQKLRIAVDQSTLVLGGMFWGALFASIFVGFFWGIFLLLFMWPDFAEIALLVFSFMVGALTTILVKWLVLIAFRMKNQKAFYRKSVIKANIVGVILQAWNLGLTSAFVLWRAIKLFIAAQTFIGRIDVFFLSDRASSIGLLDYDLFPIIFQKDILLKESHRHPYLERLGAMYLMKLRHDDFGSYAGTCWRMLFVYALAPWMRTHRLKISAPIGGLAKSSLLSSKLKDDPNVDDKVAVLTAEIESLKKENELYRRRLLDEERLTITHAEVTNEDRNTCADD